MLTNDMFWKPAMKGKGWEFTKEFYQLSLNKKYEVVEPILNEMDNTTRDRLVKALLQHSPTQSKKERPCQGERRLSPVARAADLKDKEFATSN